MILGLLEELQEEERDVFEDEYEDEYEPDDDEGERVPVEEGPPGDKFEERFQEIDEGYDKEVEILERLLDRGEISEIPEYRQRSQRILNPGADHQVGRTYEYEKRAEQSAENESNRDVCRQ